MDIRCNLKYYEEFNGLLQQNAHLFHNLTEPVKLTLDNAVAEPLIMVKMQDGSLREWTRGYPNICSLLRNGYVQLIQKCPFGRFRKCRGEKCQLYLIQNLTGDCALKWSAILSCNR